MAPVTNLGRGGWNSVKVDYFKKTILSDLEDIMKRRGSVKAGIVIALMGIAVIVALYSVRWAFREDAYISRGNLFYHVLINSPTIRNVPLDGIVGEPSFYSSCGDGPKWPSEGVSYQTMLSQEEVAESLRKYCASRGLKERNESISHDSVGLDFETSNSYLSIIIGGDVNLTQVSIREYEEP